MKHAPIAGGAWRRHPRALSRCTLGGTVVRAEHHDPVVLSPAGATVWELLAGPASIDDIVSGLPVEESAARSDVQRIVAELVEAGLLVEA